MAEASDPLPSVSVNEWPPQMVEDTFTASSATTSPPSTSLTMAQAFTDVSDGRREDGKEDRTAGKTAVEEVARRNGIVCNTSYPSLSPGPSFLSAASHHQAQAQSLQNVSTLFSSNHPMPRQLSLSNYSHESTQPRSSSVFVSAAEEYELQKRAGGLYGSQVVNSKGSRGHVCQSEARDVGQQRVRLSWSEHSDANAHAKPCEKESSFCDCACEAHRKVSQTKSLTIQLESPLRAVSAISNEAPSGGGSSRVRYHHGRTLSDFTHKLRLDYFGDSPKASDLFRPSSPPGHRQQTAKNRRSYHGPETERLFVIFDRKHASEHHSGDFPADFVYHGNRHKNPREGQLEDSSEYPQAACDSHLSAYSSDCPSDTQPLLSVPKVRVQSSPVSSNLQLCLDNSLARFPYSAEDSASCRKSSREESNGHNATTVLIPPAASSNSTGETPRLGVVVTASSPTGSETLAAPPLSELYRYHVFFSHCAQDVAWVQRVVERLQDAPYNYRCAFSPDLEQDRAALEQNLLCSAMLSERVILVLSRQYVKETWYVFEKILRQLTQMSLHNQRIMGVLLEDCVIPESLGELYFLDTSDPDFFEVFTKRLKSGRIPRSSDSVSSDLAGRGSIAPPPSVVNGQTLAQCTLAVKVGWDSYLQVVDSSDELPPSLKSNGINLERPEYCAIVHNVSTVLGGSNKLPWVLCVQPLVALLMAAALWLPAFIAVLAVQVDDNSGMALPVRLVVFVFPLGIVSCGYLLKWRRRYWLSKIVRILVQNCVKMNQLLYCEGRPILTTAGHVRANNFAVYFIYFDLTDCVRSVDLLLFTCLEDDWDKLMRLVEFYTRDKSYLAQVSMSERLTVMMAAAYLLKLVRCVLPHPPQQRHIGGQLCLCQFTEECVTRFVHALDREDVPALAELFTRHLFGYVSGSAVHRVNKDLFHRLHATGQ